ncbi:MAG TPA: hypothetical protein VIH37_00290 [Candidatus Limnocylindrales bacterium]
MSTNAESVRVPTTGADASHGARRLAVLVVVVGVALLVVALTALYLRVPTAAVRPSELVPAPAYQPGGSVYQEQVPGAGSSGHNGPGSAVYQEQVPGAGSSSLSGRGGAVYQEQVPAYSG